MALGRIDVGDVVAGRRPVGRRRFLELVAGAGAGVAVWGALDPGRAAAGVLPPGYTPTYPHGVMAGDPLSDGAVIWTKLGPPPGDVPLPVLWEVSEDAGFGVITAGGALTAEAASDHSVKVAAAGLDPDRWYFYRFTVGGTTSPTGRLRTAPSPGTAPDSVTFAWSSCQQRSAGYAAHRAMAAEADLDFFLHLGDYIYASDGGTITVDDYRGVYDTFKADPDLQALQASVPIVSMFDDGEFYNGVDAGDDPARLAAAHQAWFETMPVIPPGGDPTRAHRAFGWGDLLELFMIDVRSFRSPAIDETDTSTPAGAAIFDPSRTTLGAAQKQWLEDGLAGSAATWKALGNPYNMGLWRILDTDPGPPRPGGVHPQDGVYAPNEAWDDYWAERKELLEFIRDNGVANALSFSGHTHIWIASELSADFDDPDEPVVAHDFTCGSLTPDPDVLLNPPGDLPIPVGGTPEEVYAAFVDVLQPLSGKVNPHQRYLNFINQGYGLCTLTPESAHVRFVAVDPYALDGGAPAAGAGAGTQAPAPATVETITVAEFEVPAGDACLTSTTYSIPSWSTAQRYPLGQSEPVTTTCVRSAGSDDDGDTGPVAATPTFTG